jgi:outer membrane protein OmpA-like peptidoglycan-associated protein
MAFVATSGADTLRRRKQVRMRLRRTRLQWLSAVPAAVAIALLLLGLAALLPVRTIAQDTGVKDLLGKAQSQSETKAVEDLISKLRRQQPSPAKPVLPAAKEEPAKSGLDAGTQAKPPDPAKSTAPGQPDKDAAAGKGASTASGEVASATAGGSTDTEQMPSVDLEVLFEYKSARIAPDAVAALTTLGRALADARLAGDSFLIAGHTDAKGGEDYNLRLSQQRAEAVRDYLVREFGIDQKRLVAQGFGQRRLKVPENPLDAKNRRVQIVNFTPPKR